MHVMMTHVFKTNLRKVTLETLIPCVVCGTELTNFGPLDSNQPDDGTAFSTTGHYGSIFDPMDGYDYISSRDSVTLDINICNPCLIIAKEQNRVLKRQIKKTLTTELKIWS